MKQNSKFVYPKEAQEILGIGTTKFYELNKRLDFPKPQTPFGKRPMYIREELEMWVKNLAAEFK
ncbi:MAG: hypothetical protein C0446_14330 [Chitinophaga sp.]|nr:hypothetical protein [Chitinophaga sp.]PJD96673.1 MAG: hypothetical protein CK423_01420 [Legionella sp.]